MVYFFHVRRDHVIYLYHQGVELLDLKSAWDHALADAALLLRPDPGAPDGERWIEIDDARGHIISTAPVGTTFH